MVVFIVHQLFENIYSIVIDHLFTLVKRSISHILPPRPLSNDPRFIQGIYRYSHASKRFVEVYVLLK